MTLTGEPPRAANIVERAKNILLKPSLEWDRIDLEPATTQGLFTGYAMILAAIPPIANIIGAALLTMAFAFIGVIPAVVGGVVGYVFSLVGVFIVALIADAMAPSFDGQKSRIQALKAVIYAYTAVWVAGVFSIIPFLGIIGVLLGGLYSLYLLYLGLPKLMKVPQTKALGYTAVVVVLAIIVQWVIAMVVGAIVLTTGLGAAGLGAAALASHAQADRISGTVGVPGVGSVDLARLQAASKQMEASAASIQASTSGAAAGAAGSTAAVQAVAPDALKALLPDAAAGLPRTEISAESAGAGALGGSHAEGVYQSGDARLELEVTDTAAIAGLAGLAGAFNVNSSKDTATGYEKVSTAGGRMVTESYDRATRSGKYSVMAAGRFMIAAEGTNLSIDQVKGAVAAIDVGRVEALAKR